MIFLYRCWKSEKPGEEEKEKSAGEKASPVVCIHFTSVRYSTETDIKTAVKRWRDVDASGVAGLWGFTLTADVADVDREWSHINWSWRCESAHLDSDQHLVAVWAEVGTFCQVDFPKRSLAQLPLQHDVLPFNVLDTWSWNTFKKKKGLWTFEALSRLYQQLITVYFVVLIVTGSVKDTWNKTGVNKDFKKRDNSTNNRVNLGE